MLSLASSASHTYVGDHVVGPVAQRFGPVARQGSNDTYNDHCSIASSPS